MTAGFQSFETISETAQTPNRVASLRETLKNAHLDGFIIPRADEHQNEYVPKQAERLAWITGFTGSAGVAVVLSQQAALIVDGRYAIQAPQQVDQSLFTIVAAEKTSLYRWLEETGEQGLRIGFDPWLHTVDSAARMRKALAAAGSEAIAVEINPIDGLRTSEASYRPALVHVHPTRFSGESAHDKLVQIRSKLVEEHCDALLVSDPHNLAWAFNIRGSDVVHTPLPLGYALITKTGPQTLFLQGEKLDSSVRAAFASSTPTSDVQFQEPEALAEAIQRLGAQKARVRIDKSTCASALSTLIEAAGGVAECGSDPISLMKAVKNPIEIEGARAAHLRDGVAVVRFLEWFSREAPSTHLTEIESVTALENFRRETGVLKDISFPTIAASGKHAASPHYRVDYASNARLEPGVFLIDSGAQYEDGTTDITRTLGVGASTLEMRERFTRVLMGHIAIAQAVFPEGTSGAQLDALARVPLWQAGLDFDHGTGHGVGSYLSVHEGPQRLSKLGTVPLQPGMILSNEPGYYKPGCYGIRIENLILVEQRAVAGGERSMLGFETLTLAPIDTTLIEVHLLSPSDIAWLNAYHTRVRQTLTSHLDAPCAAWLEAATQPIRP